MNGFTLSLIFDAASCTDAAVMMEMQISAFYFNCLHFLEIEIVHIVNIFIV
jgi:hypothetical protein